MKDETDDRLERVKRDTERFGFCIVMVPRDSFPVEFKAEEDE